MTSDLQLDLRQPASKFRFPAPGRATQAEASAPAVGTAATVEDLERMAAMLEAAGTYRVLRRLKPPPRLPADGSQTRRAVFVDVETTGLAHGHDEVIELAMAAFDYSIDGRILGITDSFQSFRDPGRPLPPFVTRLTGITDEAVAGKHIDPDRIADFLAGASLAVGHNSSFDRPFCEGLCPRFAALPWGCSYRDVPWADEGFESARLGHLAIGHGLYFAGHRALDDCVAAIAILALPLPRSGRPGMAALLEQARATRWRVRATGAPFAAREALKARGYRWEGRSGFRRGWYLDVADEGLERERDYLRSEIYGRQDAPLEVQAVSAIDRYSDRC
ncbi:3'-5' exonuclease [Bradyrhizobium sp. AUGA SZCCT0160]|uniref:3'-5' exonuclease n=1 Tax=Bradyrhizobium sp. AUGA SZCCT0160 TaxID=2807662 RepID=UPI001BAAA525|nr:3'-5' exonuclease [Bradyrhizobium sp. AUGA SZCCT0160]MBR1188546.1 3'-5' exonuclease [Bradyrhizobium sp. AUGA SZCCT0160]